MPELFHLSQGESAPSTMQQSAWRWSIILIICNGLLWFLIYSFYRHGLDHADMVEAYAWGHTRDWGNNKHPPMTGWVTNIWFSLFPTTDDAFYLLTEFNLAVALYFLALSMRRFLNGYQIFIALIFTVVFSRYGIDTGYKYNANSGQLPFITGFLWCCLNAFTDTKRVSFWWLATGVFTAAAILCKYSAVLILIACVSAVIIKLKPDIKKVLLGTMLTSGIALILITPHIIWEIQHHWPSIHYMHASHRFTVTDHEDRELWHALIGLLQFSILPVVFWLVAIFTTKSEPSRGQSQRMGVFIYLLSIGLTVFAAWLEKITVESTWFIVPSIFLGWFLVEMTPGNVDWLKLSIRLRTLFCCYVVVLVISTVWFETAYDRYPAPAPYALKQRLSDDITQLYRASFHTKIENVGGSFPLPYAMSFYSPDHPQGLYGLSLSQSPWIKRAQLLKQSKVVICSAQKKDGCVAKAHQLFGLSARQVILDYTSYDSHRRHNEIEKFTVLMYPPSHSPAQTLVSKQQHLKKSG